MNYWWVNHGGSFYLENQNGYLWAPVEGRIFWENLKRVKKGDFVFSYARKHIRAIGIFTDNPVTITRHPYTNEVRDGTYLKVSWVNLSVPFKTLEIWEQTKKMFDVCINSPLTEKGKGCQGYLYKITSEIFHCYCEYIQKYSRTDISMFRNISNEEIPIDKADLENNFVEPKDSYIIEDISDIDDVDDMDVVESIFSYERDLQKALVAQIKAKKIFSEYKIFGENEEGIEYSIDNKRIDVLLESNLKNELLVIELKAGIAKKDVLGQISEYMGKLMRKFPEKSINGLIIASEIDDSLKEACLPNPNIKTKKYRIELTIIE